MEQRMRKINLIILVDVDEFWHRMADTAWGEFVLSQHKGKWDTVLNLKVRWTKIHQRGFFS